MSLGGFDLGEIYITSWYSTPEKMDFLPERLMIVLYFSNSGSNYFLQWGRKSVDCLLVFKVSSLPFNRNVFFNHENYQALPCVNCEKSYNSKIDES